MSMYCDSLIVLVFMCGGWWGVLPPHPPTQPLSTIIYEYLLQAHPDSDANHQKTLEKNINKSLSLKKFQSV